MSWGGGKVPTDEPASLMDTRPPRNFPATDPPGLRIRGYAALFLAALLFSVSDLLQRVVVLPGHVDAVQAPGSDPREVAAVPVSYAIHDSQGGRWCGHTTAGLVARRAPVS